MKKTFILLLFICSLIGISSCKKDETQTPSQPACEKEKYGTIKVLNTSANPYDFYVQGVFQARVTGGTTKDFKVAEGNAKHLYAIQVSGYLVYPTEVDHDLNVVRCSNYNWSIP